jgi:hypothetical protein
LKELDREEVDTHTLVVYITNIQSGVPSPAENSRLKITIDVSILISYIAYDNTAPAQRTP